MLYQLPLAASKSRAPFLVRDRSKFDRSFIEDLREFISHRLDRIDPYEESKDYCLQQEIASRLHDQLMAMLPEEGQKTLLAYTEAAGAAHCLEVEIMAEHAFRDGMRMAIGAMAGENVEF